MAAMYQGNHLKTVTRQLEYPYKGDVQDPVPPPLPHTNNDSGNGLVPVSFTSSRGGPSHTPYVISQQQNSSSSNSSSPPDLAPRPQYSSTPPPLPPPVPTSARPGLYGQPEGLQHQSPANTTTTTRLQQQQQGMKGGKMRSRPASVHEQDFRGLPVAMKLEDKEHVATRKTHTRPRSMHESQLHHHGGFSIPQGPPSAEILGGHQNPYFKLPVAEPPGVLSSTSVGVSSRHSQDESNISSLKAEFRSISDDRDILKEELHKAQYKLDNHNRVQASLDMDIGVGGGMAAGHGVGRENSSMGRDYDYLKMQCEQAMRDVQELKQQQLETSRKHDAAVKEGELMRSQYKATCEKNKGLMGEIQAVSMQCRELQAGEQRLKREVEDLQKRHEDDKLELSEMRKQQRDLMSESGSSEVLNMLDTTIEKYESLKQDYDNMRRNYAENLAMKSASESKVELLQEEIKRMHATNEDIIKEKAHLEKTQKSLEKHFTSIIQKSQNERDQLKQEKEECKKTVAQLKKDGNDKLVRDMGRFRKERDAVLHEYSLVMEERNTVYKEMDQLEEKLTASQRSLDDLQKKNKSKTEELETLRREIASALQDRDQAMKQVNELKDKYSSTMEGIKQEAEKRIERERSSRDGSDASSKDISTAREIDSHKREVERLKAELVDTQHEVVLAKNRRDWVFSERDKIVRERESIRTLCDKLRRERDSAVTQFMEAVKDSDELKTSKAEAQRQLKELQEKYETLIEKSNQGLEMGGTGGPDGGYSHSTDSAIDSDLSEWHTETLPIDLSSTPGNLGFELGPGREDGNVVVTSVNPGTMAFEKLRLNDVVLKINNMDVDIVNGQALMESARHSGNLVIVDVKRKKVVGGPGIKTVVLHLGGSGHVGLQVTSGIYVSGIQPGSLAAREGSLAVGDRILATSCVDEKSFTAAPGVNGSSVDNLDVTEILTRIQESQSKLSLSVLKCQSSSMMTASLLSSPGGSSGHLLSEGSPDHHSGSPMWLSTSPGSSSKTGNTPLRTSGSQTDSLDSPQPSGRNPSQNRNINRENEELFTPTTKPPPSDKKPEQSRGDSILNRVVKKLRGPFHTGDRNEREMKATSMYVTIEENNSLSDEAVIAELHEIANKFSQPQEQQDQQQQTCTNSSGMTSNSNNNKHDKRRQRKEKDSGGTWPRYRPVQENPNRPGTFQPIPAVRHKIRPPLTEEAYSSPRGVVGIPNRTTTNNSHHPPPPLPEPRYVESRLPPTPPERNESSFKRIPSVKHSPQSSDSTVTSSHSYNPSSSSPNRPFHNKSVSASTASSTSANNNNNPILQGGQPPSQQQQSQQQQSSHDVFSPPPPHPPRKKTSIGGEGSASSIGTHGYQVTSSAYSHKGYTSSSTDSTQASPDLTVVSADPNSAIKTHFNRRANSGSRPRTAPPRNREERKEKLASVQGGSQDSGEGGKGTTGGGGRGYKSTAVKPNYIDVQPVYPPLRPPPPRSLHSSSGPAHNTNSSTSHHSSSLFSPVERPPPTTNSTGGLINGTPTLMSPKDKPPPGYFVHPSKLPTQQSHGFITLKPPTSSTSSPINMGPPPPPPPPASFSPPPAYHATSGGRDHGAYNVPFARLNTPSPSPSQQSNLTYDNSGTNSEGEFYQRHFMTRQLDHPLSEASTLPMRSPYSDGRIKIPSTTSMIGSSTQSSVSKISTSSIERISDHTSPKSSFMHLQDVPSLMPSSSSSLPPRMPGMAAFNKRPNIGATRQITVEKGSETLGIQINTGRRGAIFVSCVNDNSLAAKAGLLVGDQILEVCGINTRQATRDQVAPVLRQVGASINMLVQYNPDKFQEDGSSSSISDSEPESHEQKLVSHSRQRSGGSGRSSGRSSIRRPQGMSDETLVNQTDTPTSMSPVHARTKGEESSVLPGKIRFVFYKKRNPEDHVGFDIVGGNAVGIFVDCVHQNGVVPSGPNGLQRGDQILEYNGINFRDQTAEQALVEVLKPVDSVTVRAQYNYSKYSKVQNKPGDALFVKPLFDYTAEKEEELSFSRGDILYVEDTLYTNQQGVWRAWLLDSHGNKLQWGKVPSKNKLEDEYVLRRSMSDIGEDELKRSNSNSATRRSFFRRKKQHARNNSKDSHDLHSFSDASINSDYDDGSVLTYERVERLDSMVQRPVLILGPLSEALINKITSESPDKYFRCKPEPVQTSISTLQAGQHDGVFIEVRPLTDGHFECITVDSIKAIILNNRHCMLSVEPEAIERLHKVHIYPIVLFIKHDSPKQIREFRDSRFLPEKLSSKYAKELYQLHKEHEQKFKRYFSDVIQGENLAYLCVKIKQAIDTEQKKTVWVPSGTL